MSEQSTTVTTVSDGVARISWLVDENVDVVRREVAAALVDHARVEAHVRIDDETGQRTATWSGMRREGIMRGVAGDLVVYARLATDSPVHEPGGFRALLNSFLPRKRAISQMLIRDTASPEPRVLLCQLTYKQDWDLPGGVVEVGESPMAAVSREVEEELALTIPAGPLLLTDWLPPWGGWDDALCLVFDGGVHEPSIVDRIVAQEREIRSASFCTAAEVQERATDFTARRVAVALAACHGQGTTYTESGR
ncbi:MAG: NUDIX hydrolase [Nocardioides sp.]